MRASRGRLGDSLVIFAALLGSGFVSASPAVRRAAVTASALNPWITIDPTNSKTSTVTPVLTTINGAATTLNAFPTPSAAPTTNPDGSPKASTSGEIPPVPTANGAVEQCHNLSGDFAPFCEPINGSLYNPGGTYYISWDSSFFKQNETILIQADYINATTGGTQAYQSAMISNSWGMTSWTISSDWLKGLSYNNITLFIAATGGRRIQGPTIEIGPTRPPPFVPNEAPKGKDLYIALPAVAGFIILCVCGGFIFNRKNRKIGLGNVMGRRKGYGVGKSRRQRMGGKKGGDIMLREQELVADGQYRDSPAQQDMPVRQEARIPGRVIGHRREESDLGSLVGTPTEERPRGGNAFRDEMRRQELERH